MGGRSCCCSTAPTQQQQQVGNERVVYVALVQLIHPACLVLVYVLVYAAMCHINHTSVPCRVVLTTALCCAVTTKLCCAVLCSGYGLAQRLLVMVDAACSPVGGDPFAALTPALTGTAAAAAAAGVAGGSVCGSRCSWQGCMERVRLAHEGLLLLRALVATAGTVGE
jgi:hypothetical protein